MRFKVTYYKFLLVLIISLSMVYCTEPYQLQTETYEDVIVIEATITNELKKQQIKISKTYMLEENAPVFETGANVYIQDNTGNRYEFSEQNNLYESTTEFQAVPGKQYQLFITTSDGREYISTPETLTTITEIESLSTNVTTKQGQTGVEISVNSYDPTGTSKFYRYEYEETSKITVPKWSPFKTVLLPHPRICPGTSFPGFETIGFQLKPTETHVCYTTKTSNELFLTSTNTYNEDRVVNFPVRFISNTDYTIAERYSIMVRQYVQSFEAYTFYKTLKEISGSGNILSPNQPGFFYGNLKSVTNPKEKVIGFFEVAAVTSKRIFFNFNDIFPNTHAPAYPVNCEEYEFDSMYFGDPPYSPEFPCGYGGPGLELRSAIAQKRLIFYKEAFPIFIMVKPVCGDCSTFSSNVIPPFWQ